VNNAEIYNIMRYIYDKIIINNTVLIVEHNLLALKLCSYIIEFGPRSGKNGGNIIYSDNVKNIKKSKTSILKKYL
jgi:excinuclease UvrABC ATPase subunit